MSNYLTGNDDQQFDMSLESRLEWNEIVNSEIEAFKRLQGLGSETGNYVPTMVDDEIRRRRVFLQAFLDNF
jgi:hypothetical protein